MPLTPYGRSGFLFSLTLSESQVKRLREYPDSWTRLRISGNMILKSTYGEIRKEIHADAVALIGRDNRVPARIELIDTTPTLIDHPLKQLDKI